MVDPSLKYVRLRFIFADVPGGGSWYRAEEEERSLHFDPYIVIGSIARMMSVDARSFGVLHEGTAKGEVSIVARWNGDVTGGMLARAFLRVMQERKTSCIPTMPLVGQKFVPLCIKNLMIERMEIVLKKSNETALLLSAILGYVLLVICIFGFLLYIFKNRKIYMKKYHHLQMEN